MNYISDILYWISTGLLVPVIVLLIILFGRSRDFIFRNTPDVVGEEFPKGSNTLVHAIISIIHCQ